MNARACPAVYLRCRRAERRGGAAAWAARALNSLMKASIAARLSIGREDADGGLGHGAPQDGRGAGGERVGVRHQHGGGHARLHRLGVQNFSRQVAPGTFISPFQFLLLLRRHVTDFPIGCSTATAS